MENQTPQQPTSTQHVILLVGQWLKRYSQIYPMYGKTLADFPERFDEFADEFKTAWPSRLDEAFRLARGECEEFPTPAAVRKIYNRLPVPAEQEAALDASRKRFLEANNAKNQRLIADGKMPELKSVLESAKPARRQVRRLSEEEHGECVKLLRQQLEKMQVVE